MKPTDQTPPVVAPEIYILGEKEAELWASWLTRRGYRARAFDQGAIPRLIEEFREARPRPALLITRILHNEGLDAAKTCRDMEPELKVIVATGRWHLSVLANSPVVIDGMIGSLLPLEELSKAVDRVMRAPRQAPADLAARFLAQKQAATKLLEHHSQGQPPRPPEVFILADQKAEADEWRRLLGIFDYSVRGFGPDEIPRMFEELREARPKLLVTWTLGEGCPGLVAAKTCREMEPGLKVMLAGEGGEESPPVIPANCPVTVDGTIGMPAGFMEFGFAVGELIGSARPGPIGPVIRSGRPIQQ